MRRRATFVAISCVTVLAVAPARAKTIDDLKAELAAKKADVAKLERRIRQMETSPASGGALPTTQPSAPPVIIVPAAGPATVAPGHAVAAAPPPDDEELERALERTLVREGAGGHRPMSIR